MDNISPLAKTLAESNGIDWRTIQGTGPGGQIVEDDIIQYLTRLMSGDEELPATPVDLPPPDWTGDELPAGMSAEMLSQAGVDSDIAALVNQAPIAQAPAGQIFPAAQAAPSQPKPEDDDFELELDDEPAAPAPQAPAAAAPLAADEFDIPAPAAAQPVAPTPVQPEPVRPEPVAPAPVPPAQQPAASAGGLGGLLSQLYSPAATPPAARQPEPVMPAPVPPAQAPSVQQPAAPSFAAERPQPAPPEPVHTGPVHTEPVRPEPVHTEPVKPAPIQPEPAQPAPQPAPAFQPAPAASGERPEGAVWFGVYLRRDIDLERASDLREQLNAALGQDVPLSLLVARAAQQHIGLLNLSSVAIQDSYAHRARSVGERSGSLRDALRAIDSYHEGQPDLLVANAGTFDLDELHYPGAVSLSIGRVQDGRAALSLNGNVETPAAAEFLAAVAASLEAPVALIV